jgi:hypothetical protein
VILGNNNSTPNNGGISLNINRKIASQFSLAASGTVTKMTAYLFGSGTAQAIRLVIYSDVAGAPGTLLVQTNEQILTLNTLDWVDFTLPAPVFLAAGTYWVGIIAGATNNGVTLWRKQPGVTTKYAPDTYSDGAAASWTGTDFTDNTEVLIYATLPVDNAITVPVALATAAAPAPQGVSGPVAVPALAVARGVVPVSVTGNITVPVVSALASASAPSPQAHASRIAITMPTDQPVNALELVEDP